MNSDDPLTRAIPDGDLPAHRAPLVRPASVDPDLAGTAREVATSIGTLIVQVKTLNRRVRQNRIFIGLLSLAIIAIAVLGYFVRDQQRALADVTNRVAVTSKCQAEQNDAFQAASAQLRAAAAKERGAQRALFDVLLNSASNPEQRRQATVDYYATLVEADLQRAGSVFPEGNCS